MLFLAGTEEVHAQFDHPAQGSRCASMGGSFIALNDFWSSVDNLAGCAFSSAPHAEVGLSYSRPQLLEQSYQNAAIVLKLGLGALVADYSDFGNRDYRESVYSAGYAIRVMPNLSIGVSGHLLSTVVSDNYYGTIPTKATFSTALQYRYNNQFCIGAKIFNPIFSKLSSEGDSRIPVVMNLGASYRITDPLLATAEIEKNIYLHHTSKFGIEYCYRQMLAARMGFSTYPSTWSFGIGYMGQSFDVDFTTIIHTYLGMTPQLSANYRF